METVRETNVELLKASEQNINQSNNPAVDEVYETTIKLLEQKLVNTVRSEMDVAMNIATDLTAQVILNHNYHEHLKKLAKEFSSFMTTATFKIEDLRNTNLLLKTQLEQLKSENKREIMVLSNNLETSLQNLELQQSKLKETTKQETLELLEKCNQSINLNYQILKNKIDMQTDGLQEKIKTFIKSEDFIHIKNDIALLNDGNYVLQNQIKEIKSEFFILHTDIQTLKQDLLNEKNMQQKIKHEQYESKKLVQELKSYIDQHIPSLQNDSANSKDNVNLIEKLSESNKTAISDLQKDVNSLKLDLQENVERIEQKLKTNIDDVRAAENKLNNTVSQETFTQPKENAEALLIKNKTFKKEAEYLKNELVTVRQEMDLEKKLQKQELKELFEENNNIFQSQIKNINDQLAVLDVIFSEIKNKNDKKLLFAALKSRHLPTVKKLIENGENINCCNKGGMFPLHYTAMQGDLALLELLLQHEADINCQDKDGWTPLHHASVHGHLLVIEELIKHNADINSQDKAGKSPLHYAAICNYLPVVQQLVRHGADINCQNKDNDSSLHCAAQEGHVTIVQELIKYGADVNSKGKYGQSPLHYASLSGHVDVVQELIKHEVDINSKDKDGQSLLYYAVMQDNLNIVEELIKHEADINSQDNYCWSSLHCAAQRGHLTVIQKLIQSGADINSCSKNGWTSLHLAAERGHLAVVKELIKCGADINKENNKGKTALSVAAKSDIRSFLKQHGAK